MPQERYNADWVLENRVGLVLKDFREIAGATEQLLHPQSLATYRRRVAELENRAVFEMPGLLQQVRKRSALTAGS